jgi:hypothetical protein
VAPCLRQKTRFDLSFTEDETEREIGVIGVLILVVESGHHPVVSVPLSNFRPPVVEQSQQKIPLGLVEDPTFDPLCVKLSCRGGFSRRVTVPYPVERILVIITPENL